MRLPTFRVELPGDQGRVQVTTWFVAMNYRYILVGGFFPILKNMSSSMGRMTSHILWKRKTVPNHQPVSHIWVCLKIVDTHGRYGHFIRKMMRLPPLDLEVPKVYPISRKTHINTSNCWSYSLIPINLANFSLGTSLYTLMIWWG